MTTSQDFAHLHLHTDHSLLDGLGKVDDYVAAAKKHKLTHLAVTDHGVMYAAYRWWSALSKADLHPIIGIETYLATGKATEKTRKPYHLILLAENDEGYRNLLWLATYAATEGFYYRPRVDLDVLATHSAGVIATSACLGGPLARGFRDDQVADVHRYARALREIFPDRFYVELQDHGLPEQKRINVQLVDFARRENLPLVATNDVHYVSESDAEAQDLLVCVQTGKTVDDPNRMRSGTNQMYLKTAAEMWELFAEVPDALTNTVEIAERCSVDLSFREYLIPDFPKLPADTSAVDYLRRLGAEGLNRRYDHDVPGAVGQRLDYELGVVERMGFTNYFLIVWDFVRAAKEKGILVGPGRGSAAGSLLAYALDITTLNPLDHGLLFERFLNPDRISMPDFDIDFADDRRGEVIEYVVQTYGSDRVAQIGTFGTLGPKAAIRDVGRAMGWEHAEVDALAKQVPSGSKVTLDSAIKASGPLTNADERTAALLDAARRVEGCARHASTHAAGVVMSNRPLVETVPLQRAGGKSAGDLTTQYPMNDLEALGLLKMDFLGLKTLTHLGKCVALLARRGVEVVLEDIPLEDDRMYETLRRGDTMGVFQVEGGASTRMVTEVAPRCFADLVALMALVRPGPMELAPDYCARKHGREPIAYLHPAMRPILEETYGVPLYQEQVMRIAVDLAGFTLPEADHLRKAMGKKLPKEMAKLKDKLVDGCVARGIDAGLAGRIWEMIEKFAGYGFNRCITGDTVVYRASANQHATQEVTVKDLFDAWESGTPLGKKLRGPRKLKILAHEDGRIKVDTVLGVFYQGSQRCLRLTTGSGKTITSTYNHRHLTNRGWVEAGLLVVGDQLATVGACDWRAKPEGTGNPVGVHNGLKKVLDEVRAVGRCEHCGTSEGRLEIAHLDHDRSHNERSNLRLLCSSCHKKNDHATGARKTRHQLGKRVEWDRIVAVDDAGIQETYDLEMEGDDHSFVANGIVTHNSHSAAYAVIAAQTLWLKTYHPAEFAASLMSADAGVSEKVAADVASARRAGIVVLPPSVDRSEWDFTVEEVDGKRAVRWGYSAVKGIGDGVAAALVQARSERGADYETLEDFADSVDWTVASKGVADLLAKVGALDRFGDRSALLAVLAPTIEGAKARRKARESGQISMFGGGADAVATVERKPLPSKTTTPEQTATWERELLGVVVTTPQRKDPPVSRPVAQPTRSVADPSSPPTVEIELRTTSDVAADVGRYRSALAVIKRHPGPSALVLVVPTTTGPVRLRSRSLTVGWSPRLNQDLGVVACSARLVEA